ncbi:hypothetical protein [Escherichia coli]|uniref:hypothetical protein n=2 Tax=Escherichia coli TaxID=562 RepID=UPI002023A2E6|nr:hypothetical protein [Escherichia coli]
MCKEKNFYQCMSSREREDLKSFVTRCEIRGDIQSLSRTLIMIAHWMRQGNPVNFTEYASQWTEAQLERDDGNHSTPEMAQQWPFSGKRCIRKGYSDYYPFGVDGSRQDDETEIKHAVTVILASWPLFNRDGLDLYNHNKAWEHPLDYVCFMEEAKSCLRWIRENSLTNDKIASFPEKKPTSYGLKHCVERANKRLTLENGMPTEPTYISNGAFIAAMVASGYKIKPAGRMNCRFNISHKQLKRVLSGELYKAGEWTI